MKRKPRLTQPPRTADLDARHPNYFGIGSTRRDVTRLQGRPNRVDRYAHLGYEVWRYGADIVEFSTRTCRVTKWVNFAKGLKVGFPIGRESKGEATFTLGSRMNDVLRLHGVPDAIERLDSASAVVWHYGDASVEIDDGRVRAWRNSRRMLKVSMTAGPQTTRSATITSGSTCDDVIRLLGTPDRIDHFDSLDSEIWHYGNSVVTISIADRCVRHCSRWGTATALVVSG